MQATEVLSGVWPAAPIGRGTERDIAEKQEEPGTMSTQLGHGYRDLPFTEDG